MSSPSLQTDDVARQVSCDGATIGAVLDSLVATAMHRRIFWLVCALLFIDIYDLSMGGAIAASLLRAGWTTLGLNSMFFSAAGIGAALGVFPAGILADRIGRVRVLRICLALMSVGTLLCAFAPTMPWLVAARVLAAIGMGAMPTIAYVYLSEALPACVRGRWIAAAGVIIAVANSAASIVAFFLLPMGAWRLMFALPSMIGLLLVGILNLIPESPRWLATHGRSAEAARALADIAVGVPIAVSSTGAAPYADPLSGAPQDSLIRRLLLRRLILGTGLAVGATMTSNSALAWTPTLLLATGSVARGLGDNLVIMLGAPLGSVIGYFVVSRASRRSAIAGTAVLGTCLAVGCAFAGRETGLIPLAFWLMASINLLCTLVLGIYLPELFPTSLRARGSSFALTMSRLVLILVPFGMAALLHAYGKAGIMLCLGAVLFLMSLLVATAGVETGAGPLAD